MTLPEFKNHRICVYPSSTIDFSDDEIPQVFSNEGSIQIGATCINGGNLVVTTRRVVFQSKDGSPLSIAFDFRSMVMHAITRDESQRYIFVQLLADEDEDQEAEDEVVKLIPSNESVIDELFQTMNEMSALNPDEFEQSVGDDDEEEEEDFEQCEDECF